MKSDNEKVADQLTLTKITAYAITAPKDEYEIEVKGYYTDRLVAEKQPLDTIGWYGSKGKIEPVVLHTDGKQLYMVTPVADVRNDGDLNTLRSIVSKLDSKELEFLTNLSERELKFLEKNLDILRD